MKLEFLGTGSGQPSGFRNVTSIALSLLDERKEVWLFDVGEATQHQILKTTIRPRKVTKIFISHLHGDHIFGLPGFLSSRNFQGSDNEPNTDVDIYGPKGIKEYVLNSLFVSKTRLSYKINFHQLSEKKTLIDDETFLVQSDLLNHGIDSYGFRIIEKDRPGELLIDQLKDIVPNGPLLGQLKAGQTVVLENGQTIDGKNYIGPKKKGRKIAVILDTKEIPSILELANNVDVLVHEATFDQSETKMAKKYFHSTSDQAAQHAKDAGVKRLLLTHISARYTGEEFQKYLGQAKKIFKDTVAMRDFDVVELPAKEKK